MQTIQQADHFEATILTRWPREGDEIIEPGSQLVVEEGQKAVICSGGEAREVFGSGRHTLATGGRLPEGEASERAAVIFLSTRTFADLRWGTREPLVYRDPELDRLRLRAFGRLAIRIGDPRTFAGCVAKNPGLDTTEALEDLLRETVVGRLSELLAEALPSIVDLPAVYPDLGPGLEARVSDHLERYGIELVALHLGEIIPPAGARKLIEERSGRPALREMRREAARALREAARKAREESADEAPTAPAGSPCPRCGQPTPPAARFCPDCGAPVADPTSR